MYTGRSNTTIIMRHLKIERLNYVARKWTKKGTSMRKDGGSKISLIESVL